MLGTTWSSNGKLESTNPGSTSAVAVVHISKAFFFQPVNYILPTPHFIPDTPGDGHSWSVWETAITDLSPRVCPRRNVTTVTMHRQVVLMSQVTRSSTFSLFFFSSSTLEILACLSNCHLFSWQLQPGDECDHVDSDFAPVSDSEATSDVVEALLYWICSFWSLMNSYHLL